MQGKQKIMNGLMIGSLIIVGIILIALLVSYIINWSKRVEKVEKVFNTIIPKEENE